MADARSVAEIPKSLWGEFQEHGFNPGISNWGRLSRAEMVAEFRRYIEHQAAYFTRAQEILDRMEDNQVEVSWWRGYRQLKELK